MSINWAKAEETPHKKQKVTARFLLDLRSKINSLEKELSAKNKLLQEENLKTTKNKINSEEQIKSLTSSESDLKIKLSKAETKISELEGKIKALTEKNSEFEKTISNRNSVIEKLEDDFEKRLREIENLKKELNTSAAAPKLLKQIQELLLHKGFLSDKEFYQMMNKIEEKYARINF
ncbi:MAG: hypothetical protein EU532_06715 [Promethearchaeota archaeon]|nr:MAG: hypothetical protein EU532_06715 [Candidatus Lokiarchaeota archaeon]